MIGSKAAAANRLPDSSKTESDTRKVARNQIIEIM